MKLTRSRKKYIPYCPKCKSLEVQPSLIGMLGGTGSKCMNCGYQGFCPEIDIEEIEKLKSKD